MPVPEPGWTLAIRKLGGILTLRAPEGFRVRGQGESMTATKKSGAKNTRGRWLDVAWCVGLAACIMFVAYTLKA